jgi:hypothetical protein
MYFQIEEIILWPRDTRFEPRRLPFELGMVNVISGESRTGKSAIIPIIDYCLGAEHCLIPVEAIRKACSWFGVLVRFQDTTRLFARREPGAQRSTDHMMYMEGEEIEIPLAPVKNSTVEAIKRLLDEISGLSNLEFDENKGFGGRVSFRDLAAFNFQPQNVIANPEVLFFKTDSHVHREKLRTIFPYVLGAVSPETLAKQHELARLEQELKRKQRELTESQEVSMQWLARLQAHVAQGRELGLIMRNLPADPSREELIDTLADVVSRGPTVSFTAETIRASSEEGLSLEQEESDLSTALSQLKQRMTEMDRVRHSAGSYSGALQVQRNRLNISQWLSEHTAVGCPVCGGEQKPAKTTLAELKSSLTEIEASAKSFKEVPVSFDRELQRVKKALTETSEKLGAVRIRREALSRRSEAEKARQYQSRQADRFIGQTENALELYRRLGHDSQLREEVATLALKVDHLRTEVRANDIRRRTERALAQVNNLATAVLPNLDAERPNTPIVLDISDLTVKIVGTDRTDLLSEVGSGSNWLSYHLAVILGLHQFFLTLRRNPVPGFLVVDQPSQVYFPRKLAIRKGEKQPREKLQDSDIESVKRIFATMGSTVKAAKGNLQIIVLDHAPKSVWGKHPALHEAAEWSEGAEKLVPLQWLVDE